MIRCSALPSARALAGLAAAFVACALAACAPDPARILVFSKTEGYRHRSIEVGVAAVEALGSANGFEVVATEDAEAFTEQNLSGFDAVVFLSTTGDVLDYARQVELERFIQAGGGFVGVHAASDTEFGWPWYGRLVGAYFVSHPEIQSARLQVVDRTHPATAHLEDIWERTDEWYDLRSISPDIDVLVTLDESSYQGATTGDPHPIAWTHEYDGGRAFYTGLGHTAASYDEPDFLSHLLGGIEYATGDRAALDYALASSDPPPAEERFSRVVLDSNLREPMELAVLPDGRVIYVERQGAVKLYDPADDSVAVVAELDVFAPNAESECSGCEDGLLGVTVDPAFADNRWVYLYYSPATNEPTQHLSRFVLQGDGLDLDSEIVMMRVPVQRVQCCHTGGSLAFDADGNLFLSTGDDTSPFESDDYTPIDERPGRHPFDAQGSSANTNDLRGKVLRIHPEPDGTYTIPEGNLFPPGTPLTRPEIYVMGGRNLFRISVDSHTGYLYWGDVGPDAGEDGPDRGPRGHDEINQARGPGFFGWPYFVGDNKPYFDYDFETGAIGAQFDPAAPRNDSPNNTGLAELPPATGAFIWYPYGASEEFPQLGGLIDNEGEGGRTAMAGPVFHADDYALSSAALPEYYDNKLLIYEWMRNWIMAVTLDDAGDIERIEPFMEATEFHRPMDMALAPDGTLYLLEYGYSWFTQNEDAALVRIEYRAE